MSLRQFIQKQREIRDDYDSRTAVTFAIREAMQKLPSLSKPTRPDVVDQADLLSEALNTEGPVWILWFDGGRYDYFQSLYSEYFEGELQPCWNGGIGYSGDWAMRHLQRDMRDYGFFSLSTLRSLDGVDYDARDWFDVAPVIDTGHSVDERLAALGYREKTDDSLINLSPTTCNDAVRTHLDTIDGGIIRYLKPHPPFYGLEEITSGSQKTRNTWYALWSNQLTQSELERAYEKTYRQAFQAACEIIPELDGRIIITADHGECLGDCGQLYHRRTHEAHEHLCTVPWFEVDSIR